MSTVEVSSAGHAGPLFSAIFAYGLINAPLLYLLGLGLFRMVANLRLAASARRTARQERRELRAGLAVVSGRVRRLEGHQVAVRVELDQLGTETHSKNGTRHEWTESQRRTTIHPFDIELANGTLLRCEPTDEIQLVDTLDLVRRPRRDFRTLAAELTPDEFVWAVGALQERLGPPEERAGGRSGDPYRGLPSVGYVLRAPSGGRLLVASERLDKRFARRASFHLRWLVLTLGALLLAHVFLAGYHLRRSRGVVLAGTVTDKRVVGAGKSVHRYVYVALPEKRPLGVPGQLREDAAGVTFQRAYRGQRLPLLVVPWRSGLAQLGDKPTAHLVILIGLFVGALALAIVHAVLRERSKDWHERASVTHHGKGSLELS